MDGPHGQLTYVRNPAGLMAGTDMTSVLFAYAFAN